AHYLLALDTTSGTAPDRHQWPSQMLVDLTLPGVTARPIEDLAGDAHFSEVFSDNVALDAQALIGTEGDGWQQVNAELAFERSGPERIYSSMALVECWLAHCRAAGIDDAATAATLGDILTQLATLRAMSLAVAGQLARGR